MDLCVEKEKHEIPSSLSDRMRDRGDMRFGVKPYNCSYKNKII